MKVSWPRLAASWLTLSLVLLVAAYVQFAVVERTVVEAPFRADAREYFFSAYNLSHFGVYSRQVTLPATPGQAPPRADAVRSPGYPLFLLLAGDPQPTRDYLHRVVLMQAGLGVGSVWLLYLIGSEFLRPGWSHAAALLAALSPHLAVMSTYLLSESLFTFLLFASVYLLQRALKSPRAWLLVATGMAFGLCSLVRATMELAPVVALALVVIVPRLRHMLQPTAVVLAGFLLVMAPWIIHSASVGNQKNEPSLLVNFVLHGSYPGFMYKNNPATYGDPYRLDPHAEAAGRSMRGTVEYIVERARDKPLAYLNWYLLGKPGFLLSWTNIDGAGDIFVYAVARSPFFEERSFDRMRQVMFALHWPLMLLGVLGTVLIFVPSKKLAFTLEERLAARCVGFVIFYAVGLHMVGAPFPRYGVPFRPLLFPMALLLVSLATRSSKEN